jgi:uncharacterized OsmC-like protein/organic hydroperoxide reductase OsmC/OhrA
MGNYVNALGEDIIGRSDLPAFFKVGNADAAGVTAPDNRIGDAVRTWVRSLSGFQKEALVHSAKTGITWRLVSDEGPYLNGHDAAPCPLAYLSTGMAASFVNEIQALAAMRNIEIRKLKVIQDNFYTMKGSMPRRTMVGGAEDIELVVEIDCDLDEQQIESFLIEAIGASPMNDLIRGKLDSLFKLAKNGSALATSKAAELQGAMVKYSDTLFDQLKPDDTELALMGKVGPTPKKEVAKGTATGGSSLSDEQDRRLNIGAIATLREDGIKDLQQMQYSPWGTSFRILSSEDGRAPDANTLISAGIGFCFMTQFGRFVSMLNLDLPQYHIIQDTHFSLGGASGGTGKPGVFDPVETHVYLQTAEDDQTAQDMLDISEQTCFLHALCRTNLKTRLKVVKL